MVQLVEELIGGTGGSFFLRIALVLMLYSAKLVSNVYNNSRSSVCFLVVYGCERRKRVGPRKFGHLTTQ